MQILLFSDLFQHILLIDFLRYFIAASIAYLAFWVVFKKKWQHRIIQQKPLQTKKIWFEFGFSMSTVVIFAIIGHSIVLLKNAGYTLIYDDFSKYGVIWFLLSLIFMLLLHDAYFYWTHRLMHHPKIFRRVHLIHHRSTNPSPWAAYSFHPIEAVIEAGVFVLIVFAIPAHGIALLLFLIYMIVRNVQGHLGIEFLPKNFIKNRWVNWHTTTTHHDLHHRYFEGNYGLYFTWWDRWLNTEHPEYIQEFEDVTSREKGVEPKHDISTELSKGSKILLLLLFLVNIGVAQSPAGFWQTIDDGSQKPRSLVRIEAKGQGWEGVITKIYLQPCEQPDPICEHCKGERKNAKIIGMVFLWGFKKSDGEWTGGNILDPANGTIYRSKIWLEDANTLKVRGYWGIFWRTQTWRRVELLR